ncbi:MAG: precorrin-6A reductase [Gemmiger sp.]|nr:precorrin-6A reductase [Gemmiger sp.]
MHIVIFGGTTEGRLLSHALAAAGAAVTVSVATEYGREAEGNAPGITVVTGRKAAGEMAALLAGATLCVDATHPYAAEASANIRAATLAAGVGYRRLLRGGSPLPPGAVAVDTPAQAAAYLQGRAGNILLATGVKELPAFAALGGERLYPRVLPLTASIAACEAAGIPHRNIIALQGPFTVELNRALFGQFSIRYLVSKDGGAAGGFAEKMEAAGRSGVVPVVLRRPGEAGQPYDEILQEILQKMQQNTQ